MKSAGALLPRAGAWMQRVKHGFGMLLLALALWTVWPVLPPPVSAATAPSQPDAGLEFRTVQTSGELLAALRAHLAGAALTSSISTSAAP